MSTTGWPTTTRSARARVMATLKRLGLRQKPTCTSASSPSACTGGSDSRLVSTCARGVLQVKLREQSIWGSGMCQHVISVAPDWSSRKGLQALFAQNEACNCFTGIEAHFLGKNKTQHHPLMTPKSTAAQPASFRGHRSFTVTCTCMVPSQRSNVRGFHGRAKGDSKVIDGSVFPCSTTTRGERTVEMKMMRSSWPW